MTTTRTTIIISALLLAFLVLVFIVSFGYYPILYAGGGFVSAATFEKDYRAASTYYENMLKGSPNAGATSTLSADDMRVSVLGQLIENVLVSRGARAIAGSDFDTLVGDRVSVVMGNGDFVKGGAGLYGLGPEDLKNLVVVPQAEHDILSGRLFLKGQSFDDWLTNAKTKNNVVIFSPRFYWANGEVRVR